MDKGIGILVSLLLYCFNSYQQPALVNKTNLLTLVKKDSIVFSNKGNYYYMYSAHYNSENKDFLYLADIRTKSIHKYSFPDLKLLSKIEFPQGSSGLKGFYVHNPDSIIIQDSRSLWFYVVNDKSSICDSVILTKDKYSPFPRVSNVNPVYIDRGCMYFAGYIGGVFDEIRKGEKFIINAFNLSDKESKCFGDYPDIYYKNNYGGINYQIVYNTINYKKRNIVFSFPADPKIYAFNIDDKKMIEHNPVNSFNFKLTPYSTDKEWYGALAKQDYIEYYYLNPSYAEIFYDKFRDLYYRIVELPNEKFNYNEKDTYFKKEAVLILDNKFNTIGYVEIKDRIFSHDAFITKDGIYFLAFADSNKTFTWVLYCTKKII